MIKSRNDIIIFLACMLILPSLSFGDPAFPENYDTLLYYQHADLQDELIEILPQSDAYFVTGPLDPGLAVADKSKSVFSSIRVIGDNYKTCSTASDYLIGKSPFKSEIIQVQDSDREQNSEIKGFRGIRIELEWKEDIASVLFLTTQQNRFLIWYCELLRDNLMVSPPDNFDVYATAVSNYLARVDSGYYDAVAPGTVNYDLPVKYDFYADPPDFVIEGYQNYKDYLYSYDEIKTGFAHGITAFIPTAETMQLFKDNAPHRIFPNKEAARIQHEYRTFFERGGDVRVMQTLTEEGFDTLKSGEYFFAVGVNGKIRFGREIPREEVSKIEEESGRKVPRANHAFLFPGEAILTAGAFYIDDRRENKLVKVNSHSGHYFYSNIVPSIREDISEHSNYYLLTLGHFFLALDRLGISYDDILISKF